VSDSIRAKLGVLNKNLNEHCHPSNKQTQTPETMLMQAELLCADWAA